VNSQQLNLIFQLQKEVLVSQSLLAVGFLYSIDEDL
jgi:hypothetical protein